MPSRSRLCRSLLRPFVKEVGQVQEELGAERARRQLAEERVAALEELRMPREASESETVEEDPVRSESPAPPTYPYSGQRRHSGSASGAAGRREARVLGQAVRAVNGYTNLAFDGVAWLLFGVLTVVAVKLPYRRLCWFILILAFVLYAAAVGGLFWRMT